MERKNRFLLGRRDFVSLLSKTGLLSTIGVVPVIAAAKEKNAIRADEGHVFLTKPYLQNPTENSMTVMWVTNKRCYSWIEYGETELNQKVHASTNGLVEAYNQLNRIKIDNLSPGKQYKYKVLSKEITNLEPYNIQYGETIESEVHTFTTFDANAGAVSMLILNDIHDRPASIPHLIGLNGTDPYDFVFLNGDMFNYQSGEDQIIDHLLKPCTESFATTKPFLFIRGNHETRGFFSRKLNDYFENTDNANYFSFTLGPVHFITLDTGEDKEDSAGAYAGLAEFDPYREKQARWLERQLQSREFKKAPFKVVLMHIPHYHSGDWHGTMHCREVFGPLFNKYKIDLLICGHTHRYGTFDPIPGQHNFPMVIGGGPKEGTRTLIKLKADKNKLILSMLKDSGEEVGRYELKA